MRQIKRTASKRADLDPPFSVFSPHLHCLCCPPGYVVSQLSWVSQVLGGFADTVFCGMVQAAPEWYKGKDIRPQQHEGSSSASSASVNHREGSATLTAARRNRTQALSWPRGRNCCLYSSSPWEGPLKDEEKWFQSLHRTQWLHCSRWPPAPKCWDCFSFTS